MKPIQIIATALVYTLLNGCATLTTGSVQTIVVESDPDGANCIISRSGRSISYVNPTPGSFVLRKDKDELQISCDLEGYFPTVATLDSNFQGATLGNVFLGGIVGIGIDALSGAANKYPDSVKVTLIKQHFNSERDRDAYFEQRKNDVNSRFNEMVKDEKYSCSARACKKKLAKAEEQRSEQLDDLEGKRETAIIR